MTTGFRGIVAVTLLGAASLAGADTPAAGSSIDEIVVYGRARMLLGETDSASEGVIGFDDIRLPPLSRTGELVEVVPGLVATQHSGSGKANQYFIRGFNLDHGTDFAVSVEGVPVNLRSHGHGQGYLDLNFLIPELVASATFQRGPYSARVGDFSSAASLEFEFYDELDEFRLTSTTGEFGYQRLLAAGSRNAGPGTATAAFDVVRNDGPWQLDEALRQHRFIGTYGIDLRDARVELGLQAYESRWQSTDQVPARAVSAGLIGPRGFIDPDLGGRTRRYALSASVETERVRLSAYAVDYNFELFSNFTYFLVDPRRGDEFEQTDRRQVYGLYATGEVPIDSFDRLEIRWGGEWRRDTIDEVGLYDTQSRRRDGVIRDDALEEWSLGGWLETSIAATDRLRAVLGARADYYDWHVRAQQDDNSGRGDKALISPKASLAWQWHETAELYLNWGRGFHSNDVRGTTTRIDPVTGDALEPVPALARSEGAEVGMRFQLGDRFNATLTAFGLELDSELVYVGDTGSTEPQRSSYRRGVETAVFWQGGTNFAVNMAYAATRARFRGGAPDDRRIPGAVESTFTLGASAKWTGGWQAAAKLRWLGSAPLVENGAIRSSPSLLVNAGVAYRRSSTFSTRTAPTSRTSSSRGCQTRVLTALRTFTCIRWNRGSCRQACPCSGSRLPGSIRQALRAKC